MDTIGVIGVIGAMEEEITLLKDALKDIETYERGGNTFHVGMFHSERVVLLKSGIGKVNAAIGASLLISKYDPMCVINTGSAGAIDRTLDVGDIVVSSQVVHHDVDVTAFGYDFGQVPQLPNAFLPHEELVKMAERSAYSLKDIHVHHGMIATGDSFMNDPAKIQLIRDRFPHVAAAEMEAAAIAQTCHQFKKPFVVIRSISDNADGDAAVSFDEFLKTAADNSALMVLKIIEELKDYTDRKELARMLAI